MCLAEVEKKYNIKIFLAEVKKKYNIKIFLACLNVVLVLVLVLATWTKLCSKRKLPL